jgi:hypothetical protein
MPYVQRDAQGLVIGEFANFQPGFAEEWLSAQALDLQQADNAVATERAWRDGELAEQVWLRDRHRDQIELGVETTLTAEQFTELLAYMQALRDWPQSEAFPDSSVRPVAPDFLASVGGDQ